MKPIICASWTILGAVSYTHLSGSGKTTLLNILAAVDRPTSGQVLLNGRSIISISEQEISAFRREDVYKRQVGLLITGYNVYELLIV